MARLNSQLRPVISPDSKVLSQWIAQLDHQHFTVRAKATAALAHAGELAWPALRQALKKELSPEHRQRIEKLLTLPQHAAPSAEQVKHFRAIELLEMIGTTEARGLLGDLAQGAPNANLTRQALAALHRLGAVAD
jgi:hypothetical protein